MNEIPRSGDPKNLDVVFRLGDPAVVGVGVLRILVPMPLGELRGGEFGPTIAASVSVPAAFLGDFLGMVGILEGDFLPNTVKSLFRR